MTTIEKDQTLPALQVKPDWMNAPLISIFEQVEHPNYYFSGGFDVVGRDEFWIDDNSSLGALFSAVYEINEHIREEAIHDATLKAAIDRDANRMQDQFKVKWIARIVADQCLGIKPIFGKGE